MVEDKRFWVLLTIQVQSCGTRDHSSQVGGHARVLSLMTGQNCGDLQLVPVTITRHLQDLRLCQFTVTTEPRNLQIWTQTVAQTQPRAQVEGRKQGGPEKPGTKWSRTLPSPEILHWNWARCFSKTSTSSIGATRTGAVARAIDPSILGTGKRLS